MDSTNMLDLHYHPEELLLHYQHPLLNGAEFFPASNDENLINPTSHMVQDAGLHSAHQLHLAKIKHEERTLLHDLDSHSQAPYFTNGNFGFDPLSLGMFLPSTVSIRSSFMPLQASDQFRRTSPSEGLNIHSPPFFESIDYGIQQHLQGPAQATSCSITHNEMPASVSGVNENKRANGSMDRLKPTKKPRFESRPSFSPFKVRKEKLGDRIAALQQLVAPFGKTDTASVLSEAIGYIKFLQDQVETLSVPYIGYSNNRKLCTTAEASTDERDEPKRDLRSRGLCLVPLSCTSYVTSDNIVWSPPNFR